MAQLIGSKGLKGRQKAAALLIALGLDVSAEVLKHFRETEIETLTFEIFQLEKVTEDTKSQVLEECYHMAIARDFITSGGAEYAREMLVRALGKEKAQEVIERMAASRRPQRFGFVRDSDPAQLAQFVGNEHPQTIALILAHLQAQQDAQTMTQLNPDVRTEVALRIATMDRTPPEVVEQVEDVLKRKLSSVISRDFTSVGGTQFLVNMLTTVDRGTEKQILEYLDGANAELAAEVRKLMFVFDDLVRLDDRSLQRVLRGDHVGMQRPLSLVIPALTTLTSDNPSGTDEAPLSPAAPPPDPGEIEEAARVQGYNAGFEQGHAAGMAAAHESTAQSIQR